MVKRFTLLFALAALVVASAASYRITLIQPSVVKGTALKAGDYKLNVEDSKATLISGKKSVEFPVKIENVDQKYSNTAVRYIGEGSDATIAEIRIGGTKTKIVFMP